MKKSAIIKISFAFVFFMFTTAKISAQTAPAATANVTKLPTAVRLIDNKGTIKYLQSNNGITQIVNTTSDLTTTTWQLGGELTDNTYIDVKGKVFGLDGIALVPDSEAASTNATTLSVNGPAGNPTTVAATGWTLLVRDEATGAIKKLLASSLLESGETKQVASADAATLPITATGVSSVNRSRVWVYRNGARLYDTDYSVTGDTVTINGGGAGTEAWSILAADVFLVQWLK
jgi:hypothetical protein